jgi:hypothetical protein
MPVTKPYTNTKLGKIRTMLKAASESLLTAEKHPDLADGHFAAADKTIRAALEANTRAWEDHLRQRDTGGR